MSTVSTITGIDPATGNGMAIEIGDGLITAIRPETQPDEGYLSTGLVDLQVNGFGGLDLNGDTVTPELVAELAGKLADVGVTTFFPTLITASTESLLFGLRTIAKARRSYPLVAAMVAAVHIEGPSISPVDGPRGAHPLEHVRAPSLAEFDLWQEAGEGLVGLVTLAPEYPEAPAYIRALKARNVHVALGHTAASPEEIHQAAEAGAALSTHLGNGAASPLPRHPNFIWAQLADDRLTATFIADGHHLPADTFKAMLRAKGLDRAILISDSVALAGMPPGIYEQPVGGTVEVSPEGRIGIAGTPYLAGADRPLAANVAVAADMAGLSLSDALRLATVNPGRFASGRGRLEVGARADILRFGWVKGAKSLDVRDVWIGGERIVTR